jgi:hypothetical protein
VSEQERTTDRSAGTRSPGDPMPGLRARLRSVGLVALLLAGTHALVLSTNPHIEGADRVYPWIVLPLALWALTPAKRDAQAVHGTPGAHAARALAWIVVAAPAGWNLAVHAEDDALLFAMAAATVLACLINAGLRVRLSQARY